MALRTARPPSRHRGGRADAPGVGGPLLALAPLDEILSAHADAIGRDFTGYRNHCYRVVNFAAALIAPDAVALAHLTIAAAFHDIGIWTAGTWDYLEPSVAAADAWLARAGRADMTPAIGAMIREHHRVRAYSGPSRELAEPFRQADWVDVTRGLRSFGLPRAVLRDVFARWPDAGFHRRLVALTLARIRTHPWSPLPMVRL